MLPPPAKPRESNFELLRIICMLLIICGHIIMVHNETQFGDNSWLINQFVRPFCAVAVNVFILISGYYGINLKYKKLISLNTVTTFYCIVFLSTTIAIGIHEFNVAKDWMQFLPVVTKQYWFITTYFVLCLISPFLNLIVEHSNTTQFKQILSIGIALFVILPTFAYILNFESITCDAGYGIVNFIFLYLIGRYIKLHGVKKYNRYWFLIGYICSMAICGAFQIFYSKTLSFSFTSLWSYDTIFVFAGAIFLFLFFREIKISNRFINLLAKTCLAAYIIHLNPLFYRYFFAEILSVRNYTGVDYIAFLVIAPIPIFLACALIEAARIQLFKLFTPLFHK